MSYCCPSQTCAAVVENRSRTSPRVFSGACAMRLYASMHITSPERIAVSADHFFHTVSFPRRSGERSIMSSWMRVKVWNTSRPAAGPRISGPNESLNRLYTVRHSFGRSLFPPMATIYRSGSYSPSGSWVNSIVENSRRTASSMVSCAIIAQNYRKSVQNGPFRTDFRHFAR